MNRLKTFLLVTAAGVLTACATATPYQQAVKSGGSGYSHTQIESDRFTVSFAGNSLTDRETVETYLLYRAAEVALENGYSHFTLDDKDTEKKTRLVSTGSSLRRGYGSPLYGGLAYRYDFFRPGLGWGYGYSPYSRRRLSRRGFSTFGRRGYDPFWDDFDYREVTKYKAHADIRLRRADSEDAFSAREVIENLGPKLLYPEVKS